MVRTAGARARERIFLFLWGNVLINGWGILYAVTQTTRPAKVNRIFRRPARQPVAIDATCSRENFRESNVGVASTLMFPRSSLRERGIGIVEGFEDVIPCQSKIDAGSIVKAPCASCYFYTLSQNGERRGIRQDARVGDG